MSPDEIRLLEALGQPVAVFTHRDQLVWADKSFEKLVAAGDARDKPASESRAVTPLQDAMTEAIDAVGQGASRAAFDWTSAGDDPTVFRGTVSRLDDERRLVVLEDVSRQIETEALYQDARDYLDRVLNQLPVGVIAFDGSGRITFFNTSQADLSTALGLRSVLTDVIGAPVSAVYPVLEPDQWGQLIETVTSRGEPVSPKRFPHPAGETVRYLQLQLYPLKDRQGRAAAGVCVTQDVSRLVELEQELVKKERLAVAGQLVATFHHQINNPLVSILGMAEMMLYKSSLDGELAERVERIRSGALRIAEVTKKMREIRELGRNEWPQELPTLAEHVMRPSA